MEILNKIIDAIAHLFCPKQKDILEDKNDEETLKLDEKQVVSIKCPLYLQPNQDFITSTLSRVDSVAQKVSNQDTSLRSIFGEEISPTTLSELLKEINNDTVPLPLWQVSRSLTSKEGGFHDQGAIYINETFILNAEKSPEHAWTLFRVMIEEIGHYLDYLLRNKYDTIQGDAKGDEGTLFASHFIYTHQLLTRNFNYATFTILEPDGTTRQFLPKVLQTLPTQEAKAKTLLYVENKSDDRASVILNNGKQVVGEFFKIRGAGAIHENLTQKAAIQLNIVYDYRLDEGCAWPDVPCNNEYSIETCYFNTWRNLEKKGTLAYESHYGKNQYWHSMAPSGERSNQEIIELIITQANKWFTMAVNAGIGDGGFWNKTGDDGLFHIGKILHMIQDAFSESHIQRNHANQIIQIQGYDSQDAKKHGEPDKKGHSKGAQNALKYSLKLLRLYKVIKACPNELQTPNIYLPQLEDLLRNEIYMIQSNRKNVIAGGTVAEYSDGGNG